MRDCVFYIRAFRSACECTWKYRSISSNRGPAELEIKDTINKVKYVAICMPLITCGSIHEGHEWFSDYSRRRQEIYMCLAVLLCSNFADSRTEVPRYRSSQSYLMRSFFFVSVFLAAVKCYTKLLPFGVNCRL